MQQCCNKYFNGAYLSLHVVKGEHEKIVLSLPTIKFLKLKDYVSYED